MNLFDLLMNFIVSTVKQKGEIIIYKQIFQNSRIIFERRMKDACPEHVDWLHVLDHEYSCLRCIDQHQWTVPQLSIMIIYNCI